MDTMTPLTVYPAAQKRNAADNAQKHGAAGLLRYHSAPSSVLSGFCHNQDVFCGPIPHVDDSELTWLLAPTTIDVLNVLSNAKSSEDAKERVREFELHAIDILPSTRSTDDVASGSLAQQQVHSNRMVTRCPTFGCNKLRNGGHLSPIFEHTREDPRPDFGNSTSPSVQNAELDVDNCTKPEFSPQKLAVVNSVASFDQPLLATAKRNLIRYSSFPAEILSRLGVEKCSESPTPSFTGPYTQSVAQSMPDDNIRGTHTQAMGEYVTDDNIRSRPMQAMGESMPHVITDIPHGLRRDTHLSHALITGAHCPLASFRRLECNQPLPANGSSFTGINNLCKVKDDATVVIGKTQSMELPPSCNQKTLFRQSSSPAGLVSQLSFDRMASGCKKALFFSSSASPSEEDRRGGVSHFPSRVSGFWDEAGSGMAASGQRKRGRETEAKIADGLCVLDPIQKCSVEEEALQWSSGGHMEMNSGSLLSMDDSVLCRARAKRGCATHPRSIAERVRRTKISDSMRKLQELVPNMEKQTNTATMLDEAVDYVKFLQQQVQKLSERRAACNGMCHLKGNT
eukprot:c36559_g1_i1 orf=129-1832(+)